MERGKRKELIGIVVSDKMDKTRVVSIETWKKSPIYGKRVRATRKVKAHDEKNETSLGDKVKLCETRPLSKEKRWRIAQIIEKSRLAGGGKA